MKKKLILLFVFAPVLVLLLAYGIFTIHIHYRAEPALLTYIHSSYPHIDKSDLCLSSLPMPTRNWDIKTVYSFVYNDSGERLNLIYYYRNSKRIVIFK